MSSKRMSLCRVFFLGLSAKGDPGERCWCSVWYKNPTHPHSPFNFIGLLSPSTDGPRSRRPLSLGSRDYEGSPKLPLISSHTLSFCLRPLIHLHKVPSSLLLLAPTFAKGFETSTLQGALPKNKVRMPVRVYSLYELVIVADCGLRHPNSLGWPLPARVCHLARLASRMG